MNKQNNKINNYKSTKIYEKIPGVNIEIMLNKGKSFVNSNNTILFLDYKIEQIQFKIEGKPQNEQEKEIQENFINNPEAETEINEKIKGKTLYMLISETEQNEKIITIPSFRGNNEIYDGSTRMFVEGNYDKPTIEEKLGKNIIGIYHLSNEEFPNLEEITGFHNLVSNKQKIRTISEEKKEINNLIKEINNSYELICRELKNA